MISFDGRDIGSTVDILKFWDELTLVVTEVYPDLYGVAFEEDVDASVAREQAKALLAPHRAQLSIRAVAVLEAIVGGDETTRHARRPPR